MALDTLTKEEWEQIAQESDDIGCLYQPEVVEQEASSQPAELISPGDSFGNGR